MESTNQGKAPVEVTMLSKVIQINKGKIQTHLGGVVHSTLEDTLSALLDAEADRGCPQRLCSYERVSIKAMMAGTRFDMVDHALAPSDTASQ